MTYAWFLSNWDAHFSVLCETACSQFGHNYLVYRDVCLELVPHNLLGFCCIDRMWNKLQFATPEVLWPMLGINPTEMLISVCCVRLPVHSLVITTWCIVMYAWNWSHTTCWVFVVSIECEINCNLLHQKFYDPCLVLIQLRCSFQSAVWDCLFTVWS